MNQTEGKRIIGLDMHPDVFAAAALGADPERPTAGLEAWAKKQLRKEDVVVLEASGNSGRDGWRRCALAYSS